MQTDASQYNHVNSAFLLQLSWAGRRAGPHANLVAMDQNNYKDTKP